MNNASSMLAILGGPRRAREATKLTGSSIVTKEVRAEV